MVCAAVMTMSRSSHARYGLGAAMSIAHCSAESVLKAVANETIQRSIYAAYVIIESRAQAPELPPRRPPMKPDEKNAMLGELCQLIPCLWIVSQHVINPSLSLHTYFLN
jgi:hypothetical protein